MRDRIRAYRLKRANRAMWDARERLNRLQGR